MIVKTPLKNVIVNYTYYLKDKAFFTEMQINLLKLSVLNCKSFGFTVYFHCNKNFREILDDNEIPYDVIYKIEDNSLIDNKTFWAYWKFLTYNSRPIGEWHLDVDAIFKEKPSVNKEIDLQVAYLDDPNNTLSFLNAPDNYKLPTWANGNLDGFNMSAVCFNNDTLKDVYCSHAFSFIKNNFPIQDNGWEHMVWVEQACLKRLVEYYKFSYNFISDEVNYYHLGAAKNTLTQEEIYKQNNKIKEKICQHLLVIQ